MRADVEREKSQPHNENDSIEHNYKILFMIVMSHCYQRTAISRTLRISSELRN